MSQRLYLPFQQVFSNIGIIGAGYKIYTYETGTSTPKATFSDIALTVPNTNPIVADSAGRFGNIYGSSSALYKFVLTDASGSIIETRDPVDPQTSSIIIFDPIPAAFWGTTTGTSSSYILDSLVDISAIGYKDTEVFMISFHIANAAGATLNIDSLGPINLTKYNGAGATGALEANDVLATNRYWVTMNGSSFVVLNPEISPILRANNLIVNTSLQGSLLTDQQVTISNNGSDANNDIDFTVGVGHDKTNNFVFNSAAITKRFDAAWAAGTGNGGLDVGSSKNPNTSYFLYVIYNPTTNVSDAIATTTFNSPTLPTGYTRFSYCGTILTDGSSNNRGFTQNGQHFDLKTMVQSRADVAAPIVATLLGVSVPIKGNIISKLAAHTRDIGSGTTYYLLVNPSYSSTTPSATNNTLWQNTPGAAGQSNSAATILVPTNSSGQILINATSANSLEINSLGWIDTNL